MIPVIIKEVIRYIVIALILMMAWDLSLKAHELEIAGKLTLQFAGVVGSAWGAVILVLKFILQSKVSKE